MPSIRLGIAGVGGRMGRALLREAAGDKRFEVAGATVRDGSPLAGSALGGIEPGLAGSAVIASDAAALFEIATLVLDFSAPRAARLHAECARQSGAALLVGTTGLERDAVAALESAACAAPVLIAPNTSLGIGLLVAFARQAAARLGTDFRVEIEDVHHKDKKDAPSGTALMLGSAIAEARGVGLDELRITSERTGAAAGKHRISFVGELERIELIHEATDRAVFARGALDAGHWLAGQTPGFYTMADFLSAAARN